MTAAPMESCPFVAQRPPGGRLGSALYTCNRLHRIRRRFQHISANSLSAVRPKTMNSLAMASRALGRRIDGVCGTGDHSLPDLPREASRSRSTPEKSVQFGPDGAPFPSKTSIYYPRPPRNRNSGRFGPHATPPIVNYEYMTSTRREGYFGLSTLGT